VQETEPSRLPEHTAYRAGVAARSVLRPDEGDAVVRKTVDIIARRYAERLSLVDLACEVGVSRYRLSHRFHRFVGMSLRQYLLTVRLERAKELLGDRGISITVIAQDVGFSDLPRFDKLFRRYTGQTPSAFRVHKAR
jgi:AraC-like DNA-binding protein